VGRRLTRLFKSGYQRRVLLAEGIAVAAFVLLAFLGPIVVTADPAKQDLSRLRERPSRSVLLGRDELGREILPRIVHGARYTIGIGFLTVTSALLVGGTLGLFAGYFGARVDTIVMRLMDVLLTFPGILLALAMITILGTGLINVVIAVSVGMIPVLARIIRAMVLRVRQNEFVLAAYAIGASDYRIVLRHILPNIIPFVLVQSTYSLAEGILNVAGLGFLGIGVQPPTPEWGVMLSRAREVVFVAPHITIVPGLALLLLLLSVNLLGDALRDALDPQIRRLG
jgi:peptide/nickel transport system permease protein